MRRAVQHPPRFHSQAYPPCGRSPLSGFLAGSSFAAMFHAATVRGILPSESSPHKSRAPLSRSHAPWRLVTIVLRRRNLNLSSSVSSTPALLTQLPDSPDDYELPFHAPKCASRSLWIQAPEPSRSDSFIRFEALLLLRVRSRRLELPRDDGRSSPGFSASLKVSPTTPWILYPLEPRGLEYPPHPKDQGTTQGTHTPRTG